MLYLLIQTVEQESACLHIPEGAQQVEHGFPAARGRPACAQFILWKTHMLSEKGEALC